MFHHSSYGRAIINNTVGNVFDYICQNKKAKKKRERKDSFLRVYMRGIKIESKTKKECRHV